MFNLASTDLRRRARVRAQESREVFGFNNLVPIDIWKLLQSNGISVIKEPLESEISGLFMRKGDTQLILINSARTLGHQNFTAAHELFHLRYNPEMVGRACKVMNFNSKSQTEREADLYAAYFLAPDEAIKRYLTKHGTSMDIAAVIFLEQFLGLSHQAMLIRLQELGVIDSAMSERMSKGVVRTAKELGYNTDLYRPTNDRIIISDYAEKAKRALEQGLISFGRYEELLIEAGLEDIIYGGEDDDGGDEAIFI
ncbi:hypothetical protein MOTE_10230 [Moorella thermoacetica]|uniref:IrrE N-terminal-like domain-containing protein n=1 Tax=Neomoorella thermoacetica TaxID=1525 RepID=A0A1J5NVI3_NEOTH|nr:hypothetical protein MOTE_10230 [Moorella thermoacetica]